MRIQVTWNVLCFSWKSFPRFIWFYSWLILSHFTQNRNFLSQFMITEYCAAFFGIPFLLSSCRHFANIHIASEIAHRIIKCMPIEDHINWKIITIYLFAFKSLKQSQLCAIILRTRINGNGCLMHFSHWRWNDSWERWMESVRSTV